VTKLSPGGLSASGVAANRGATLAAGRAAGVMVVASIVRRRTRAFVVLPGLAGAVLLFLAANAHGWAVPLLLLGGLVGWGFAGVVLVVRRALLMGLRRVGGPEFGVVEPVLERHLPELREASRALPTTRADLPRLVLLGLRPQRFRAQLRRDGETLARLVPSVVTEARAALEASRRSA